MNFNSVWLIVLTMLRSAAALLSLLLSTLLLAGAAQAANLNFNGGAVAACSLSASTYTCNNVNSLGSTDSMVTPGS